MNLTNNTIPTTNPDLSVELNLLEFQDLVESKDGIINVINDILQLVFHNWELQIVAVISVLAGIILMKKYDEGLVFATIFSVIIYLALRAIGIGG